MWNCEFTCNSCGFQVPSFFMLQSMHWLYCLWSQWYLKQRGKPWNKFKQPLMYSESRKWSSSFFSGAHILRDRRCFLATKNIYWCIQNQAKNGTFGVIQLFYNANEILLTAKEIQIQRQQLFAENKANEKQTSGSACLLFYKMNCQWELFTT